MIPAGGCGVLWLSLAASAVSAQRPATPVSEDSLPNNPLASSGAPAELVVPLARRDVALGLAHWDHSLLGAFQLGARLLHFAGSPAPAAETDAGGAQWTVFRRARYGPMPPPSLDAVAKALRIDQLERQGMNLNMKSAYGSFRFQYREIFNSNGRTNLLGGGVGQAAAAASWTAPRFGPGSLFNLSAAALLGSGSINQLLGSGYGTSLIGGNGPGHKSQTAPTVAIKLTF